MYFILMCNMDKLMNLGYRYVFISVYIYMYIEVYIFVYMYMCFNVVLKI